MNEPVKQVTGVLGSRTCFRMELYGKNILAGVGQTLVGTVVDIDECGNRYGRIQLIGIYHIAVVLRGNIYSLPDGCLLCVRISFYGYLRR